MASIASSPLVPIVTGIGALALILGTLSNGDIGGDDAALAGASSDVGFEDPTAGAVEEPVVEEPAAVPATSTLTAGKAGTVGGLKLTVASVTAKGAKVTVGKKSYNLTTNKAATIGKYTVTVTKVNTKAKRAAVSVEGG